MSHSKFADTSTDRATEEALYASKVASSPLSSKRAKPDVLSDSQSGSVGLVSSWGVGFGDAPTHSPAVISSPSGASPSMAIGIEALVQSPTRTGAPHSCPASNSGLVSML